MGPIILSFPDIYMDKNENTGKYEAMNESQQKLVAIEQIIDIMYCIDICINFIKATRINREFKLIALNYLYPTLDDNFILDSVGTLSGIISG